jgi:branched-chain amino acid aminotransferase
MNCITPELIWWNGRIVPWSEAMVHVTSETALRGTNIFEGLRAYWHAKTGEHAIVALKEHMDRLAQSARILRLPVEDILPMLERGIEDLIRALKCRVHLYLRPTVYLESGGYSGRPEDLTVGSFIVGRPLGKRDNQPISCIVSTWHRTADIALPTIAKIGAAYTAFRLARMEANDAGVDEAILLNARGVVAETGGAAVFIIRNGRVITPPLADGILDSITRRIILELLSNNLGVAVSERSILRSELYAADEMFICGTLDEVRAVERVDQRQLPNAPGEITRTVRDLFLDICEGKRKQNDVWWLHTVRGST